MQKINRFNRPQVDDVMTLILHYTPLTDRAKYLKSSQVMNLHPVWITERDISSTQGDLFEIQKIKREGATNYFSNYSKFLLARKLLGNSYASTQDRRIAFIKAFIASRLPKKVFPSVTNTFVEVLKDVNHFVVPKPIQELVWMHVQALVLGVSSGVKWILVLEDDSVLNDKLYESLESSLLRITKSVENTKTIVFLNSSETMTNLYNCPRKTPDGLFRVRPRTGRNASAYLISRDAAIMILNALRVPGNSINFPPDFMLEIAIQKFKFKTFWQDPPLFVPGSENGSYYSNLEGKRSQ